MRTLILFTLSFSLLSASHNANADWCAGKKWLIAPMTMQERVSAASDALKRVITNIDNETKRLNGEVNANSKMLRKQLKQQHKELSEQTIQLCQTAKKQVFPLSYGQIELGNTADYHHQLQLNLRLIHSQQQIMQSLQKEESSFDMHLKQLKNHRAEVALLQQQTLVWKRSPVSSLQFVQQACTLTQKSDEALEASQAIIIYDVLGNQLDKLDQDTIDDALLQRFIKNCTLAAEEKSLVAKGKAWWGDFQ